MLYAYVRYAPVANEVDMNMWLVRMPDNSKTQKFMVYLPKVFLWDDKNE